MSVYSPDRWVVVRISNDTECIEKVLAGWYGGYLGSDSWKLSSGITHANIDGDVIEFHNHSGSVYRCHKNCYGMSGYMASIYSGWEQDQKNSTTRIKVLAEDWLPSK